jgi:hypothetical protein
MRIAAEPEIAPVDTAALASAVAAMAESLRQQEIAAMQHLVRAMAGRNVVMKRLAAAKTTPQERATALVATVSATEAWIANRQRVIARAQLPAPAPTADAWTLSGFVIDAQNQTVTGAQVQLLNGDKQVGSNASVDSNGQCIIKLTSAVMKSLVVTPDKTPDAAKVPSVMLAVRVLDAEGSLLSEPGDRFVPEAGVVDQLNVIWRAPSGP